jgi:aminopeptidase YwaD
LILFDRHKNNENSSIFADKNYTMYKFAMINGLGLIFLMLAACNNKSDISMPELREHIEFLASDSLKGRYPGTAEMDVARDYILKQMEDAGLNLLSWDGMQEFEVTTSISKGKNNHLKIGDSCL